MKHPEKSAISWAFVAVTLTLVHSGCRPEAKNEREARFGRETSAPADASAVALVVPDRTPQLATYPCMKQCHAAREPNPEKRELTQFHSLKQIEHGDTTFWCPFCHNDKDLDTLRLLDGRTVTFNESYRLCGQCHGDKRRDWQAGIHGLQSGSWDGRGEKVRRPCTACHDPHAPKRPTFQTLPPPRRKGGSDESE